MTLNCTKLDPDFMGYCSGHEYSSDYRSLEGVSKDKAYLFLSMRHGINWLKTLCGKYWLNTTKNGKRWLLTSDGKKWLESFEGTLFYNFYHGDISLH